jgi:hypothetical protein
MDGPVILSMGKFLKMREKCIHIPPSIGGSKAVNEVPGPLRDYHGA